MARSIVSIAKAVTTAGTAEAVSATKLLVTDCVLKASADNVSNVYVGASDVDDSNGYPLAPGEAVSLSEIDKSLNSKDNLLDLSTVYLDVDSGGDGDEVRVLYVPQG